MTGDAAHPHRRSRLLMRLVRAFILSAPAGFLAVAGFAWVHSGLYGFTDSRPSEELLVWGVTAMVLGVGLPVVLFLLNWLRRRTRT
jgi:hypothetical protein